MSATKPDFLERWLRERFRLRDSLRSAWEAVRVRDEIINITVRNLKEENMWLRQFVPADVLEKHDNARPSS